MFERQSSRPVCFAFLFEKKFFIDLLSRPTFAEILDDLNAKAYVQPIYRSLELTIFNGVVPLLDHNLDLNDFTDLHSSS